MSEKQNRIVTDLTGFFDKVKSYLVSESTDDRRDELSKKTKAKIAKIGHDLCRAHNMPYSGFVCVFISEEIKDARYNYGSLVSSDLETVMERSANMAWNDIKTHCMKAYGRELPKVRQDLKGQNE